METLFENVFPFLILFLVVGWWILRGVFKVLRRSVTGMDEEVEVGRLAERSARPARSEQRPATAQPTAPALNLALDPAPETNPETGGAHIADLPSIDDLARANREARDQMRVDMPSGAGLPDNEAMSSSAPTEIVYPGGSDEMIADAWNRIYSDDDSSVEER